MHHFHLQSFIALGFFSVFPACTVDTVVDGVGPELSTPPTGLYAEFLAVGMPSQHAASCVELQARIDETWVLDLVEGSLLDERLELSLGECEEYDRFGRWREVSDVGSPVVTIYSSDYGAKMELYLECMARPETTEVADCSLPQWEDFHTVGPAEESFWMELGCAGGTGGGHIVVLSDPLEQQDFMDWAPEAGPRDYGVGAYKCPDGDSYFVMCAEPDAALDISCSCQLNGIEVTSVSFANHRVNETFDADVFEACGFAP